MRRIRQIKEMFKKARSGNPEYQIDTEEGELLEKELEKLEYQYEAHLDSIKDDILTENKGK